MFKSIALLTLLLLSGIASALPTHGTFNYSWNHPLSREDGVPFTFAEIGKYQVFWKLQSASEFDVVDLPPATLDFERAVVFGYYNIKVRVCDIDDICSNFTKLRSFVISAHPTKPGYTILKAGKPL